MHNNDLGGAEASVSTAVAGGVAEGGWLYIVAVHVVVVHGHVAVNDDASDSSWDRDLSLQVVGGATAQVDNVVDSLLWREARGVLRTRLLGVVFQKNLHQTHLHQQ